MIILHCRQEFLYGCLEWFQILLYDIPKEFKTDLIIIVNQNMSHTAYQMPFHIRVCFLEVLRHFINRLAYTLYIIRYCMTAYLIVFKLLI